MNDWAICGLTQNVGRTDRHLHLSLLSNSGAAECVGPTLLNVEQLPVIEDARGVDISQIKRQLRMSVPERVRTMVETANVMLSIQRTAQASLQRQVR